MSPSILRIRCPTEYFYLTGWDDRAIQNRLFPPTGKSPPDPRPLPDFATVHEERCRHKHVTLMLLWDEYKQAYPEGYQYSQFCDLYHRWRRKLDLVLRQEHRAGEKLFVDYAGDTVPIVEGFGLELEPKYVDAALKRFRDFTGEEPVQAETGRTLAELE